MPADPEAAKLTAMSRRTIERYADRYRRLGVSPRTLGWGSSEDQRIRFDAVANAIDLRDRAILDWGCGFGDLLEHLRGAGIHPATYTGVDLSSDLVNTAAARFAGDDTAAFRTADESDPFPPRDAADVVVMLGLANFEQPDIDTESYARRLLNRGFAAAREAVVCDFLSTVPTPEYTREAFVHYYDPPTVLSWGLELSSAVALHHDYGAIPQLEMLLVVRR